MYAIANDARKTVVELANEIEASTETIRKHLRKLKQNQIIQQFTIIPNEDRYPYQHYKTLIQFRAISAKEEGALREFCRQNPNIVYIVKSLGPWDFEIDVETETAQEFREVMRKLKAQFSHIIKEYSNLHVFQVHKYNFFPSIK